MRLLRLAIFTLALTGGLAAPAAAQAARRVLQPVTLGSPGEGVMKDTIVEGSRAVLPRASAAATAGIFHTADGYAVSVTVSATYAATHASIQSFVDLLGKLPHGSEMGRLKLLIAAPEEVGSLCGGGSETLACYVPSAQQLIAPGEQPPNTDLTPAYIIAHEYGHHVANNRTNSPFSAEDWGPKYWSSSKLVCLGVTDKRYFPGDEGDNYAANPGEAWAETYAQLTYPGVAWDYLPSLKPDSASLAAARRDVTSPWKRRRSARFSGELSSKTRKRDFRLTLKLDGSLSVALSGPKRSNYDLAVRAQSERQGSTSRAGSRDKLSFRSACRASASENLTVRVVRRSGSGRFKLTVKYAG